MEVNAMKKYMSKTRGAKAGVVVYWVVRDTLDEKAAFGGVLKDGREGTLGISGEGNARYGGVNKEKR